MIWDVQIWPRPLPSSNRLTTWSEFSQLSLVLFADTQRCFKAYECKSGGAEPVVTLMGTDFPHGASGVCPTAF